MSSVRMILITVLAAFLLSACAGTCQCGGVAQYGTAEQKLSSGIKYYEDGDYNTAVEALQHALDLGFKKKSDHVSAHKYLAFIYCVTKRENQCAEEFKNAFELDPGFDLKPEEAGHPVWGPVFRSVKVQPAN